MISADAQLAVLNSVLGRVEHQLAKMVIEQERTNVRLAKLESWRSFVVGMTAATSGILGYLSHFLTGK